MSGSEKSLADRLARVGQSLGEREAPYREALSDAWRRALQLRGVVAGALDAYSRAAARAGASNLSVRVGDAHIDDKHLRSVEFDVSRGRHRAIVTVKSRGEVTLVGPFKAGKTEGPCKSFPYGADDELHGALGDFLESFLEEAATP
jgi:hypothetical protein